MLKELRVIFASTWMSPSSVTHFNVVPSLFSAKPSHRRRPNHLPRRLETNVSTDKSEGKYVCNKTKRDSVPLVEWCFSFLTISFVTV